MAKDEIEVADEADENEVQIRYDIATYPSDFTLSGITDMWLGNDITIPEFQREFVWTIKQSSLLIDSFLSGLPVPPVFFYIDDENKNLVIDGQQRILSVVQYFSGYFGVETSQGKRQVFRLKGLDKKSPYADKIFSDLKEVDQRRLRNSVLRAINIRQLAPIEDNTSIYHIFERLNTGGTALKPQEIRNCVFRGSIVHVLRELNNDENWRKIVGNQKIDKHQKDVELVLRLLALTGQSETYEVPMKEWLNKTMKKEQAARSAAVRSFKQSFPDAAALVVQKLGEKPFHVRGPLNAAVMDAVMGAIIEGCKQTKDLKSSYTALLQDQAFIDATSAATADVASVKSRFRLAKKYLCSKKAK